MYERLALASAAIWAIGTFLLFVAIVPVVPRPQRYIAVAMILPLLPAALPWLFYGWISERVARRWYERDLSETGLGADRARPGAKPGVGLAVEPHSGDLGPEPGGLGTDPPAHLQ